MPCLQNSQWIILLTYSSVIFSASSFTLTLADFCWHSDEQKILGTLPKVCPHFAFTPALAISSGLCEVLITMPFSFLTLIFSQMSLPQTGHGFSLSCISPTPYNLLAVLTAFSSLHSLEQTVLFFCKPTSNGINVSLQTTHTFGLDRPLSYIALPLAIFKPAWWSERHFSEQNLRFPARAFWHWFGFGKKVSLQFLQVILIFSAASYFDLFFSCFFITPLRVSILIWHLSEQDTRRCCLEFLALGIRLLHHWQCGNVSRVFLASRIFLVDTWPTRRLVDTSSRLFLESHPKQYLRWGWFTEKNLPQFLHLRFIASLSMANSCWQVNELFNKINIFFMFGNLLYAFGWFHFI